MKNIRALDPAMPDADILALAVAERRVVVTMDKDFGELVYQAGRGHAGVLLLRMKDAADGEVKRAVLEAIMTRHQDQLSGSFAVYQGGRLRVRS